ncbi:MAG: hypothetical protein J5602_10310 [Clostridia bacterium]|nr:hypothetical protein [Clostridia bacterium]
MKKSASLLLALCVALLACAGLSGCSSSPAPESVTSLSFADATSIETIRSLNGKTVSIMGYMATLSPVSGKFMYLMNMPYQSCPFCVPNTTQLANTMAVYAPNGKTFAFTDQPVKVTGKMELGDFTDEYGYVYNYRIVNAACEQVDLSSVSENYALWQAVASDGVVAEINSMIDYLYFVCQWTEYTFTVTDENGMDIPVNMYPGDAEMYLAAEGPYGFADKRADGYFPGLVARLKAISGTELNDIIDIVNDAKALETYALQELADGHYSYNGKTDKYTLTNSDDLFNRWLDISARFSEWLAKWQM